MKNGMLNLDGERIVNNSNSVPEKGLEPLSLSTADFESAAYTIPPLRLTYDFDRLGLGRASFFEEGESSLLARRSQPRRGLDWPCFVA